MDAPVKSLLAVCVLYLILLIVKVVKPSLLDDMADAIDDMTKH